MNTPDLLQTHALADAIQMAAETRIVPGAARTIDVERLPYMALAEILELLAWLIHAETESRGVSADKAKE